MTTEFEKLSELIKEVCRQLFLSQENLTHKLGVSFATINRWKNGKMTPSGLARVQFDSLCKEMQEKGYIKLLGGNNE